MKTARWIPIALLIAVCLCGNASAGIEEMFAGIESPAPQDGLVLEIALPKKAYFFFEPVTVFARFRNTTQNAIALVLEGDKLAGLSAKLAWEFSSPDEGQHRPSIAGSTFEGVFLVPPDGAIYFALPDKLFPIGTTRMSIEYRHDTELDQPDLSGVAVWQGNLRSNELVIVSEDKDDLTPEEQSQVESRLRRHIELFKRDDWTTRYLSENHLIWLSRYSVPILIENLSHPNAYVRAHVIETLGKIADQALADEIGFQRDVTSLDDLLATYERERNPEMKQTVVYALLYFKGMPAEKHRLVVQTLRKAINQTNKPLRAAGAVVLLRISKADGIPEVIDRMADNTYFGNDQKSVLGVLKEEAGQDLGTSTDKWRSWWQESKDKIAPGN